jgi:hypothetical protein
MDPVSAFGIAAGAAQLAEQAANVFLGLFKYLRTVKRAPKLSSELREEAFLVHNVLEELKSTLDTTNTPSMTHTLNDTVKEFAKTMKELENQAWQSEPSRLGSGPSQADVWLGSFITGPDELGQGSAR